MQSRMDRYKEKDTINNTRSIRNKNLYKDIYEELDIYDRLPVSENVNEIDLETLRKITTRREYQEQNKEKIERNIHPQKKEPDRIYDINKLLELARTNTSLKKISSNTLTNYDNLTKLNDNIKKESLEEEIKKELDKLDKEIENVKKEIDPSLDLLEDLKGDENTIVTKPAKKEDTTKTNLELQKEFYSSTLDFNNEDFSSIEEEDSTNSGIIFKIVVIILTITAVALAVLYVIKNIWR